MSLDAIDIEGQHVVLREDAMAPAYRDLSWRVVLATGGFGCHPLTRGRAVFVEHVRDGERARWSRDQIERLATQDDIDEAEMAARDCFDGTHMDI
jgi:hypothetical protein